PLQLVLLITPESVFGVVFPTSFQDSADLARVITIGTLGLIVGDMLLKALFALGKAGAVAKRIPLGALAQLVAMAVLVPRFGALGAAASFALGAWTVAGLLAPVYLRHHRPTCTALTVPPSVARWAAALGVLVVALAAGEMLIFPLDLLAIAVGV